MNWDMVGALGEIVGAIAVLATLGYLAKQIRLGAQATEHAAAQDILNGARMLLDRIASSPDTSRIYRLGMAGDEGLSPDELIQFRALLTSMVYDWIRIHHVAVDGGIQPWMLESHSATRRDIVGTPGFRQWFEIRRHWIPTGYRAVLEEEMRASPGYQPLALETASPEPVSRYAPEEAV